MKAQMKRLKVLAIVRKIVEAHGGEVSFDPNAEKGVTFRVRLPVFAYTSK
jgi:signal transduction histidine kinase